MGGKEANDLLARLVREFPVLPTTSLLEDFEKPSGWAVSCPENGGGIRITTALRPVRSSDPEADPRANALGAKMEFSDVRDHAVSPGRNCRYHRRDASMCGSVGTIRITSRGSHKPADAAGEPVGEVFWSHLDFMGCREVGLVIPRGPSDIPLSVAGFVIHRDPLSLGKGVLFFSPDALTAATFEAWKGTRT